MFSLPGDSSAPEKQRLLNLAMSSSVPSGPNGRIGPRAQRHAAGERGVKSGNAFFLKVQVKKKNNVLEKRAFY